MKSSVDVKEREKVKRGASMEELEQCEVPIIHHEVVEKLKREYPYGEEAVFALADFLKNFGDATRLRILISLKISEMCVCDLAGFLQMSQSAISHQLRILKAARLVKNRRAGKVVYYSLNDDHIHQIIAAAMDHINE